MTEFAQQADEAQENRRFRALSITGLASAALISVLAIVPLPFAVGQPGPTFDTLHNFGPEPAIVVSGVTTYPPSGELHLTTVSVGRTDRTYFSLGVVLRAFASPGAYVVPVEAVFGSPGEEDAADQANQQAWVDSQAAAAAAALTALGAPPPGFLRVVEVSAEGAVSGILTPGDVLVSIDETPVPEFEMLSAYVDELQPGEKVDLVVDRGGQEVTYPVTLGENETGRAALGVWLMQEFDLPLEVDVRIDQVGGPSAGVMFALAIMDKLTAASELQGKALAGTGQISPDGAVHPIGGIVLKMYGARAAGLEHFLAPTANCAETVGHVPAGLHVYAISNLAEAYDTMVALGADAPVPVPTCAEYVKEAK